MLTSRNALAGIGYMLAFAFGMLASGPALAQSYHQQANAPCAAKATHAMSTQDPAPAAADPAPIPWDLLRGGP